ncbi:MAG: phosphotransferase [Bdellovibrionales bacterium]|nr:phosphotransferase [Bdellovibrionales bacterium]
MKSLILPAGAVEEIRKIMEKQIIDFVSNSSSQLQSLVKLPGDASSRKYYRATFKQPEGFAGALSCIVMRTDPFVEQGLELPFLVVRSHLHDSGVRVPSVYNLDPARGLILLEDLGDATLLRVLQECANSEVERHYYERVIDSLVQLQTKAGPAPGAKSIDAFRLEFDQEKLMWEVRFTFEHFYEKYLKRSILPAHRAVMEEGFIEICARLASEPKVLAHRDFHSRNVMVLSPEGSRPSVDSEFVMIDFQDARMGPAQYDLASLLKDSYYQLEESQIQRLIDYYIARYEALSGKALDRRRFIEIFDLMAVQRNFKAIGSFASFLNRRGDASYLKYIGNTFENIRRTLLKYPQYSALRETLFHYYYF